MKRMKDFYPPTPEGFHNRLEETLNMLEPRQKPLPRKTIVLVAAVLLLALAGTAVAVVQGGLLRRETERVPEINENVTDVQAESSENGFSLSIDEVLWEDRKLQISYTLNVPDDGQMYLAGLYPPALNGEALPISRGVFIDESSVDMQVMGGGFPTRIQDYLSVRVDPSVQKLDARKLEVNAAFFTTDRKVEPVENRSVYVDMINAVEDMRGQYFANSDIFYYVPDEGSPRLSLLRYKEMGNARSEHYDRYLEESGLTENQLHQMGLAERAYTLAPEDIAATGLVEHVNSNSVTIDLDKSMKGTKQFNALAETTVSNGEYTVEITSFHLNRLEASYSGTIRRNDGQPVEMGMSVLELVKADGTKLDEEQGSWLMGDSDVAKDGSRKFNGELTGYFELNDVQHLALAPSSMDENFVTTIDMEKSVIITPIYDEAAAIAEINATPEPTQDPAEVDDISSPQ